MRKALRHVSFVESAIFVDSYRPICLRLALTNIVWGIMWFFADSQTVSTLTGRAMTPEHTPAWVSGAIFIALGLSHLWMISRGNLLRLINAFISLFFWLELAIRAGFIPLLTLGMIVPISLLMLGVAIDSAWVFWRLAGDLRRVSIASTLAKESHE